MATNPIPAPREDTNPFAVAPPEPDNPFAIGDTEVPTPRPREDTARLQEKRQMPNWNDLAVGFRGEVAGAIHIARNITGVIGKAAAKLSKQTGEPWAQSLKYINDSLAEAEAKVMPEEEDLVEPIGVGPKVARGVGAAPVMLLEYKLAGKLARKPPIAFALVDAAREVDKGYDEALKAGFRGAATGYALGKVGEIAGMPKRIGAGAAVMGTSAAIAGGGVEDVTASAVMGAGFSVPGAPKGARQKAALASTATRPTEMAGPEPVSPSGKKYPPGYYVVPPADLDPVRYLFASPTQLKFEAMPEARAAAFEAKRATERTTAKQREWGHEARLAMRSIPRSDQPKLAALLEDPNVNASNPPKGVTPKMREAFLRLDTLLENVRKEWVATERKLGNEIAEDAGIPHAYWPHSQKGIWAILLDGEPVKTGWLKESKREANAERNRLIAAHPLLENHLTIEYKEPRFPDPLTPIERSRFMALKAIRVPGMSKGQFSEYKRLTQKIQANRYGRLGKRFFGAAQKREANLPGYVTDERALYDYIDGMARYTESAPLRPRFAEVQEAIEAKYGKESRYASAWKNYTDVVEGRPGFLERAVNDVVVQKIGFSPKAFTRALGFVRSVEILTKLGLSPVTAVAQMSQTVLDTYPVLGGRYTRAGIRGAYEYWQGRTLKHFGVSNKGSRWDWLVEKLNLRDEISKADEMNTLDTIKLYAPREWTEVPGYALQGANHLALWAFTKGDLNNRVIAAIGAYQKALAGGKTPEQALRFAKEVELRTQFGYDASDAPVIMSTPALRTIFQFRSFYVKQMEFMLGLGFKKGKLPGRMDTRRQELGRLIGATVATTGVAGVPGALLVDRFLNWYTDGKYSLLEDLRKQFPWAHLGLPGLIGMLPGVPTVDITQNVGFGDWFSPRQFQNPTGPLAQEILLLARAGIANPGRDRDQLLDQLKMRVSPAARRYYQMWLSDAAKRGELTDYKGRTTIKDLSDLERWLFTMGFTPERSTREREDFWRTQEKYERRESDRGGWVDSIVEARKRGDQAEAERLIEEAEKLGHRRMRYSVRRRMLELKKPRLEQYYRRHRRTLREIGEEQPEMPGPEE